MARKSVKRGENDKPRGEFDASAPELIDALLAAIVKNAGNITKSCHEVTDTEYQAHMLRVRVYTLEKTDEEFAERFRSAQAMGADVLEDEVRRRAFDGIEEPVFYQGVATDVVRKYSNTLAVFLLKGAKPEKYKDRVEHTGDPNAPVSVDVRGTPLTNSFLKDLRNVESEEKGKA